MAFCVWREGGEGNGTKDGIYTRVNLVGEGYSKAELSSGAGV